ncbi:MAG: metal-dependent hydrolase [Saprospiraceae bacterium]
MNLTFYGQACFGVDINGKHLLFDPMISSNPLAKDIDMDSIPADYILLTHAHFDHTENVEQIATRTGATIVANWEIHNYYQAKGYKTHPMNQGGKWKFDFGTVKSVAAVHTSSFVDGTYGGNPNGFVIWGEGFSFYHAGDTALTMDMKLIPMTCPKLDFAILPIGDNFTMGFDDAVIAASFIECDKIVGCHFDTFGFIKIDHEEAKKAFATQQKALILPEIGETVEV